MEMKNLSVSGTEAGRFFRSGRETGPVIPGMFSLVMKVHMYEESVFSAGGTDLSAQTLCQGPGYGKAKARGTRSGGYGIETVKEPAGRYGVQIHGPVGKGDGSLLCHDGGEVSA